MVAAQASRGESREPVWARPDTRRRSVLSREAIVRAAVAVADAEGLGAVSIRRIAVALDARAMSLYTYIDRKEDLFDLMAEEVAGEVLIPGDLPAHWRDATLAIARRERDATRRHPWMIDVVTRQNTVRRLGPNMLRHLEQSVAALAGLDVDAAAKWRLVAAVNDYTTGYILRETRERAPGAPTPEVVLGPYLARILEDNHFPHLGPMLRDGPPHLADDNFEQGLDWLLDGMAREHGVPRE